MKILVDNQILKSLASNRALILPNSGMGISFRWPTLLEYLERGSLLRTLPLFDQDQPLFHVCVSTLCETDVRESLYHLYDTLFAENLSQITTLPLIQPYSLLQAIKEGRQKKEESALLSPALAAYETALTDRGSEMRHNLILYLAWDRMCMWMARIFDYHSSDPQFIKGIGVLKECLIESYQHILQQGRTIPGVYRMVVALLFYQMREENRERLTPLEWRVLSQSFQALKGEDELVDFFYIDDAVGGGEDTACYATLDSPEKVEARLTLVHYMMDQLRSEFPSWNYLLCHKKIVYLEG